MIRAPFPIRTAELKTLMFDHFSRYGTIRCVIPNNYESNHQTDKALVVFHHEEGLTAVFDDPDRHRCIFKSTSRSGAAHFDIEIHRTAPEDVNAIWIKVSSERFDSRSRSSSPSPRKSKLEPGGGAGEPALHDTQPCPPSIRVWATPRALRSGSVVYRASVFTADEPEEQIQNRARAHGGRTAVLLQEFDLGRRIPEREFLPPLVDFFVEIHGVTRPSPETNNGWVFRVSGPGEARYLMDQLIPLPGFTARYATEQEQSSQPPPDPHPQLYHLPSTVNQSPAPITVDLASPPLTPPGFSSHSEDSPTRDLAHELTRQVMPTYKGRPLRELLVDGETRYIDDAAVFVGRLVKDSETHFTLLRRFERYGKIVAVEYNPHWVPARGIYTTARVLFQSAESASRAVDFENGAVSFGSALKVEPRKVLPLDVVAREVFVDSHGRVISTDMLRQYTPPTPRIKPRSWSIKSMSPVALYDHPEPWSQTEPRSPHEKHSPPLPLPACAPMPPSSAPRQSRPQPPHPQPPYPYPYPPHPQPPHPHQPLGFFSFGVAPVTSFGNVSQEQLLNMRSGGTALVPMLWQMNLGLTGSAEQTPTFGPPQHLATAQPPQQHHCSPASSPPQQAGPYSEHSIIASVHTVSPSSVAHSGQSPPRDPSHVKVAADTSMPPPPPGNPNDHGTVIESNKIAPRLVGTKFEDGMFKPIYDPEQLQQWREANGIRRAAPQAETLQLFPLHTGGHGPAEHFPPAPSTGNMATPGVHPGHAPFMFSPAPPLPETPFQVPFMPEAPSRATESGSVPPNVTLESVPVVLTMPAPVATSAAENVSAPPGPCPHSTAGGTEAMAEEPPVPPRQPTPAYHFAQLPPSALPASSAPFVSTAPLARDCNRMGLRTEEGGEDNYGGW